MEFDIYFSPDGTIQAVYADAIAPILREHDIIVQRASHVEPKGQGWIADMAPVGGPVLEASPGEPFTTRAEALAAETEYLHNRLEQGSIDITD